MPIVRKRRAAAPPTQTNDGDSDDSIPQPPRRRLNRSPSPTSSPEAPESPRSGVDATSTAPDTASVTPTHPAIITQASIKLIRLALSSEHARQPLRRIDITTKVLATTGAVRPKFQPVFDAAQLELRSVFGMELVELPAREKVTLAQRRKAQKAAADGRRKGLGNGARARRGGRGGGASGARGDGDDDDEDDNDEDDNDNANANGNANTNGGGRGEENESDDDARADSRAHAVSKQTSTQSQSWILTSVLPPRYRTAAIVTPAKTPTAEQEAAYTALTTFVIALISLSAGALAEAKLERHLKRANADVSTPVGSTERVLQRMVKEGYVVRVKDMVEGDETVEYIVGPRGKVEVGEAGVAGLVEAVWQDDAASTGAEVNGAELAKKVERSLVVGRVGRGRGG